MNVLVVDYGLGNLASVSRALEDCGARVEVAADPTALDRAGRVVLPGVGAFADAMARLRAGGWAEALTEAVRGRGLPLLGICLGMQLLADAGEEGGQTPGLGLVPGPVRRLRPDAPGVRVPHMGWNEVYPNRHDPLFQGIPDAADFYFVHSYHLRPADPAAALATTPYCGGFVSAVAAPPAYGVQFHPEKSARWGRRLLANFLDL